MFWLHADGLQIIVSEPIQLLYIRLLFRARGKLKQHSTILKTVSTKGRSISPKDHESDIQTLGLMFKHLNILKMEDLSKKRMLYDFNQLEWIGDKYDFQILIFILRSSTQF